MQEQDHCRTNIEISLIQDSAPLRVQKRRWWFLVRSRCLSLAHQASIHVKAHSCVKNFLTQLLDSPASCVSVRIVLIDPSVEEIPWVVGSLLLKRMKLAARELMAVSVSANRGSGLNLVENRHPNQQEGHYGVWQYEW